MIIWREFGIFVNKVLLLLQLAGGRGVWGREWEQGRGMLEGGGAAEMTNYNFTNVVKS